jgi:hypothetical protein
MAVYRMNMHFKRLINIVKKQLYFRIELSNAMDAEATGGK